MSFRFLPNIENEVVASLPFSLTDRASAALRRARSSAIFPASAPAAARVWAAPLSSCSAWTVSSWFLNTMSCSRRAADRAAACPAYFAWMAARFSAAAGSFGSMAASSRCSAARAWASSSSRWAAAALEIIASWCSFAAAAAPMDLARRSYDSARAATSLSRAASFCALAYFSASAWALPKLSATALMEPMRPVNTPATPRPVRTARNLPTALDARSMAWPAVWADLAVSAADRFAAAATLSCAWAVLSAPDVSATVLIVMMVSGGLAIC